MNFKIEITGLREYQQSLSVLVRHKVPMAVANALNSTVFGAREAEQKAMGLVFDRPTPVVKRGVLYQKASANNLSVTVSLADDYADVDVRKILAPQIFGGPRSIKRSERGLRRLGVLGAGQFITPGPGARRDQYGNIPGPEMVKILSGAGIAEYAAGYQMNITERSRKRNKKAYGNLFVIARIGVFRRLGPNSVIPMLYFSKAPTYRKRFGFYEAFRAHVEKHFMKNLLQAWGSVMLKTGFQGK